LALSKSGYGRRLPIEAAGFGRREATNWRTSLLPGTWLRDRDEIHATMAAMFAGELKGSEARHEVQQIRFVGGDVAVVISRSAVQFAGQAEPVEETRALDSWVLAKHGEHWQVEAFHSTPARIVR
jgi:uncharacterized protein (TIGR02246 family)